MLFHKVTPMLFSTHAFCHPKRFTKFSPMFFLQSLPRRFSPMFFKKFSPMFFITHLFSHILFSPNFFPPILFTHIFHPYFLQSFHLYLFHPYFFSTKCFLQNLNLILFHLSLVIGILSHILFFHPCFFIHTFKKVFTCTFLPILFSPIPFTRFLLIPFYKVFTRTFHPYFPSILSTKFAPILFFTRL